MNGKKNMYIDIHALQTLPPNNINRDDTGSPKTAYFGGVLRQRVSSQAWKKAIRDSFQDNFDTERLGVRTKRLVEMLSNEIAKRTGKEANEQTIALARKMIDFIGLTMSSKKGKENENGALFFIGRLQMEKLADLAIEYDEKTLNATDDEIRGLDKEYKKKAKSILNVRKNPQLNAVDVAMFGRMAADAPALNVDATVQVAHAIGVSKAEPEFDYFTALDDLKNAEKEDAGAAMIETTEFMSSTLYRYANIDVKHLCANLGDPKEEATRNVTKEAINEFIRDFITSMPTGKQNSFANRTLPSCALIQVKSMQPVSLANAFEKPVIPTYDESATEIAATRLVDHERSIDSAFGKAPDKTYVIVLDDDASILTSLADNGEPSSIDDVLAAIDEDVSDYLSFSFGAINENDNGDDVR